MKELILAIKKRNSCRNFKIIDLNINNISNFLEKMDTIGPFGNKINFSLLNLEDFSPEEAKSYGTYGIIKNAKHFVVGIIENDSALTDFGYLTEKIVLNITKIGLSTIWLGGTFNRGIFSKKYNLKDPQMIPAIIGFGFPSEKTRISDNFLKFIVHSKHRKDWENIFFLDSTKISITYPEAKDYYEPLECLRLSPSSVNVQPWRVIKESSKNIFHFYYKKNRLSRGAENIDIGIAMAHFEIGCHENDINGKWSVMDHPLEKDLTYTISWIGD